MDWFDMNNVHEIRKSTQTHNNSDLYSRCLTCIMEPRQLSRHSNEPHAKKPRNRSSTRRRARDFWLLYIAKTGAGSQPVSYTKCTGFFSPQWDDADCPPRCSVKVTNVGAIHLFFHTSSWRSEQLKKPSATPTFTLPAQVPSWKEHCLAEVYVGVFNPSWQIL
jgi:hypothetical protein